MGRSHRRLCASCLADKHSHATQAMPLEWPTSILTGGVFQVGQLPGAPRSAVVFAYCRDYYNECQQGLEEEVCTI